MVVLLPDPALGGERRRADQLLQAFERVAVGQRRRGRSPARARRAATAARRAAPRSTSGPTGMSAAISPCIRSTSRPVSVTWPITAKSSSHFSKIAARLGLAAGAQHHQHPLLAFAEHDLVGGHAGLAHRHQVEVERDAEPALAGHLDRGRGQPGRAHVLDRDDRVALHQFEAGLDQQFLGERVADLHRRALLAGVAAELGRGHRRAMDAVAPGLGADIDDRRSPAPAAAE